MPVEKAVRMRTSRGRISANALSFPSTSSVAPRWSTGGAATTADTLGGATFAVSSLRPQPKPQRAGRTSANFRIRTIVSLLEDARPRVHGRRPGRSGQGLVERGTDLSGDARRRALLGSSHVGEERICRRRDGGRAGVRPTTERVGDARG